MLVYEDYFHAGVSTYISHITIFTFTTKAYTKAKHTSIQKSYVFAYPMYMFSENGSYALS